MVEFMDLLKRLVVAVETAVKNQEIMMAWYFNQAAPKAEACDCLPPISEPDVACRPPISEPDAEADQAHLEREALKAELKAKGIAFKASARTETLRKLLESSEPLVEEAAAPNATIEQAREALVSLSAARGKDVALEVLKSAGGSAKLGEVIPEKFAAIVQAAMKEIVNG